MKNKWLLFLLSFLIVLALVLSACASTATEAPAVEEPAAEEPAAEEPAAEEPAAEEPAAEEPAEPKTATITFFEEPDTLNDLYSDMWFAGLAYDFTQLSFWQR